MLKLAELPAPSSSSIDVSAAATPMGAKSLSSLPDDRSIAMSSSGPAAVSVSLPRTCLRPCRAAPKPPLDGLVLAAWAPCNTAAAAASPCPGACCAPDLAPWAPAVPPGSCAGSCRGLSCGSGLALGLAPAGLSPGDGGVTATATATDWRRRASLAAWPARVLAKESSCALGVGCGICGRPGKGRACACGAAEAGPACPTPAWRNCPVTARLAAGIAEAAPGWP